LIGVEVTFDNLIRTGCGNRGLLGNRWADAGIRLHYQPTAWVLSDRRRDARLT
jgi:hypothetical protein